MSHTFEGYVGDLPVTIEFEYQPEEPMTRSYPGADASIDVCSVKLDEVEIIEALERLDAKSEEKHGYMDSVEEQCWEQVNSGIHVDEYASRADYLYDQAKDRALEECYERNG